MKLTFIKPNMFAGRSSDAMMPLAFAYLAYATPDNIELSLYDERIESINFDAETDMVAISVETFSARRAYSIASRFRERNIPVVMGGFHPSMVPDEAAKHCDAVVIGDAESVWRQIIDDHQSGSLQKVYQGDNSSPLKNVKVDRGIFAGKKYSLIAPIQFGRGCRYDCDFCSIHSLYGDSIRTRPVNEVVKEIGEINQNLLFFIDDNFFYDANSFRELLKAIKPLNVKWVCQISIDITKQPKLVELMAEAGCIAVVVGFESRETGNLRQMNKQVNMSGIDYSTAIGLFQSNGIMIYGTFVIGYDLDTTDTIKANLDFALEHNFLLANFNPLTPTPATPLYRRLKQENRLLYNTWWNDPTYRYGDTIFRPKLLSPDELKDGCYQARRRFYKLSSIAKRGLLGMENRRNRTNLSAFLLSNFVSRKEVRRKQGRILGE